MKMRWKDYLELPAKNPTQRLVWEVVFLFSITVAIGFLAKPAAENVQYSIILTVIFVLNLLLRFALINQKGDWIFYLIGVVAGGGNDLLSMIKGVYSYTSTCFIPYLNDLLPIWMILFWGQVFLLFRKIFNLHWIAGEPFKKDGKFIRGWVDKTLVLDLLILVILRTVIYNTYDKDMWIPALIYGLVIIMRFIIVPLKLNEVALIVILPYAFLYEGLLVTFGLYQYINPSFLGMPLWLFFWWLFLVPTIIKEVFDRIEYFIADK